MSYIVASSYYSLSVAMAMAMEAPLVRENSLALPPLCLGERRITHYSSLQKILLVGEGDFSFSNALATAFGDGRNIVATSLDTQETVLKKYADAAAFTLANLEKLGALLLHGVDATRMAAHSFFCKLAFDRVIYNFPHAGFHGAEDDKKMIKQHKQLVRLFFENAAKLLRLGGEVHVSHKVSSPYSKWKLEKQAAKSGLMLKVACDFHQCNYPGYVNRRGDGSDSAGSFHLGKCKTFIFKINPVPFHPWRELSHLLGRRSLGFFHKMCGGRQGAPASVLPTPPPFPLRLPLNLLRQAPFEPRGIMGPCIASLPVQNISSMKRRREEEDGYTWEMLEQQRFSKRGCFGFLRSNIPPTSQLLLRPFEGRMLAKQHPQGMFANVRMHTALYPPAGHTLLPSFH